MQQQISRERNADWNEIPKIFFLYMLFADVVLRLMNVHDKKKRNECLLHNEKDLRLKMYMLIVSHPCVFKKENRWL